MPLLIPPKEQVLRRKLCLVGEFAVGKTSLVNRYLHDAFLGRYIPTVGAKIQKAELQVQGSRAAVTIWDIMGEKGFRELLREAYFEGAHGILAVTDLTRRGDLEELEGWISAVFRIAGRVPVVVVGNKADLQAHIRVGEEEVAAFAAKYGCPHRITSALTGEGVDEAFQTIAKAMVAAP